MKKLLLTLYLSVSFIVVKANDSTSINTATLMDSLAIDTAALIESYNLYLDSIEQSFNYLTGEVTLNDDIATITVPAGYKYLDGETSEMVLTNIWGNPPSDSADQSLGMLMKENETPFTDSSFCINITYSEEGYIEDDDAKDIDYDELLETMIEDTEASNEYRIQEGYDRIKLIGWASTPFYDEVNKKLHWAKELQFGEYEGDNTLNYNIRILGRRGYLQLNAIGQMYVLNSVKEDIDPILASVNFNEGNRYADFNPELDRVAAYGIGGLIAGKALLKMGVLAKLGVLLAKFWKVILIAAAAVIAGAKKFFFKSK